MQRVRQRAALVVDDDDAVRTSTAGILRRLGCDPVHVAHNGAAALEVLASTQPPIDVIVTDIDMPDLDGVELIRAIAERGYAGDLVLMSGTGAEMLTLTARLATSRKLSVVGALAKPFRPAALSAALGRDSMESEPDAEDTAPDGSSANVDPISPEELAAAINAGEFEPWFQPKIDVATKRPIGVEALARWMSRRRGSVVLPEDFIPIAEEHGLIDELTFDMVAKVIAAKEHWRELGVDLKVAVNVSMSSLQSLDFPDRFAAVVTDAGGGCGDIQLEVTESRLAGNIVRPLDVLLRLRLKGVTLSIDDFGTGHSSLAQLRDLPFDELKMDRAYLRTARTRVRSATILGAAVKMAGELGMQVVAEGVESLEDWHRVRELGCDQAQGFFMARPMPADELPGWLSAWEEQAAALDDAP